MIIAFRIHISCSRLKRSKYFSISESHLKNFCGLNGRPSLGLPFLWSWDLPKTTKVCKSFSSIVKSFADFCSLFWTLPQDYKSLGEVSNEVKIFKNFCSLLECLPILHKTTKFGTDFCSLSQSPIFCAYLSHQPIQKAASLPK